MPDYDAILDALIERHYYSEEWELQGAFLSWVDGLPLGDRLMFESDFARRVSADPASMVNLSLAAVLPLPGLDEALAAELDRQSEPNQHTRSLLAALRAHKGSARAFQAVERFVDSSQEMEALRALAAIDFPSARAHLRRALLRDDLLETCLHLFAERARRDGLPALLEDLRAIAGANPAWIRPRLDIMLTRIKTPETQPLLPVECAALLTLFPDS